MLSDCLWTQTATLMPELGTADSQASQSQRLTISSYHGQKKPNYSVFHRTACGTCYHLPRHGQSHGVSIKPRVWVPMNCHCIVSLAVDSSLPNAGFTARPQCCLTVCGLGLPLLYRSLELRTPKPLKQGVFQFHSLSLPTEPQLPQLRE